MIYLKPLGGLCNRLRTIDSIISFCKIHKRDLTVLWVKDESLNCNYQDLFEIPKFEEFNFIILNCPNGFPDDYPNFLKGNQQFNSLKSILYRQIKNVLKSRFLSSNQKKIRNTINIIPTAQTLNNEELANIYASNNFIENKTTREMDAVFIENMEDKLKRLFKNTSHSDIYISSCYRLFKLENNYSSFVPVQKIQSEINYLINSFGNTVGLHIRRSDHLTSKNYSTNDKFIKLVESLVKENPTITFFLSTDDSITKTDLLSKYEKKIMYNKISNYDRNSPNAVKDAVKDLYCLAATQVVYGSHHSSFSQTAADIGQIEEITVK